MDDRPVLGSVRRRRPSQPSEAVYNVHHAGDGTTGGDNQFMREIVDIDSAMNELRLNPAPVVPALRNIRLPSEDICEPARVKHEYNPQQDDELFLKRGSTINVISKNTGEDGWWEGESEGHYGVFPSNHVEPDLDALNKKELRKLEDYALPPRIPFSELDTGMMIGQGGFCKVLKGSWNGKAVAIKAATYNYDDPTMDAVKNVQQEGRLFYLLRHKNIVQCLGITIDPPELCLVLEYCAGGSLNRVLSANHQIPAEILLNWAIQIAQGMKYLHDDAPMTLVHRDLKSSNVLVKEYIEGNDLRLKTLKITDFGLARQAYRTSAGNSAAGTYAWMAPEAIRYNQGLSKSSDVWSYGVLLWELLTGETPYKGIDTLAVAFGVAEGKLHLPIPSGCPEDFKEILNDCRQYDPEKRPSFRELLYRLQECARGSDWLMDDHTFFTMQDDWKVEIESILSDIKQKDKELDNREQRILLKEKEMERLLEDLHRREMFIMAHEIAVATTPAVPLRKNKLLKKSKHQVKLTDISHPTEPRHLMGYQMNRGIHRSNSESPPTSPMARVRPVYDSSDVELDKESVLEECPLPPTPMSNAAQFLAGAKTFIRSSQRGGDRTPTTTARPPLPPSKLSAPVLSTSPVALPIIVPSTPSGTPAHTPTSLVGRSLAPPKHMGLSASVPDILNTLKKVDAPGTTGGTLTRKDKQRQLTPSAAGTPVTSVSPLATPVSAIAPNGVDSTDWSSLPGTPRRPPLAQSSADGGLASGDMQSTSRWNASLPGRGKLSKNAAETIANSPIGSVFQAIGAMLGSVAVGYDMRQSALRMKHFAVGGEYGGWSARGSGRYGGGKSSSRGFYPDPERKPTTYIRAHTDNSLNSYTVAGSAAGITAGSQSAKSSPPSNRSSPYRDQPDLMGTGGFGAPSASPVHGNYQASGVRKSSTPSQYRSTHALDPTSPHRSAAHRVDMTGGVYPGASATPPPLTPRHSGAGSRGSDKVQSTSRTTSYVKSQLPSQGIPSAMQHPTTSPRQIAQPLRQSQPQPPSKHHRARSHEESGLYATGVGSSSLRPYQRTSSSSRDEHQPIHCFNASYDQVPIDYSPSHHRGRQQSSPQATMVSAINSNNPHPTLPLFIPASSATTQQSLSRTRGEAPAGMDNLPGLPSPPHIPPYVSPSRGVYNPNYSPAQFPILQQQQMHGPTTLELVSANMPFADADNNGSFEGSNDGLRKPQRPDTLDIKSSQGFFQTGNTSIGRGGRNTNGDTPAESGISTGGSSHLSRTSPFSFPASSSEPLESGSLLDVTSIGQETDSTVALIDLKPSTVVPPPTQISYPILNSRPPSSARSTKQYMRPPPPTVLEVKEVSSPASPQQK